MSNPSGLIVTGYYDDGSSKEITTGIEWTFNPETLSQGTTSVDVTASYGSLTSKVTVSGLTVTATPTLESIVREGYTTSYIVGDTFKRDGTVTATYSDASTKIVTSLASFSEPDMSTAGDKIVIVSYGGKEAQGKIKVSAASGGGETKYFVKVTSAPTDWSGEYLIVCEDQNVAFDGSLNTLDVASNNVSVTITENRIEADDNLLNSTFTINAEGTTIQSKSGYYIGGKSTKDNGMQTSKTDSYNHTLSINTAGEFVAYTTLSNNISNYLRCNPNSGNQWFRYYKSSSYTGQKAVQLYKLEN